MSDNFITNECRVCKHELPRPLYTVNQCELETCVNCGFVQVKDVPDGEILNGLYSEAYFDRGKYVDDLAARHEFKRRLKMLAKQGLFKDAKLLDFGGGTGEFLHGVYGQKRRWSKTRRAARGTQRTFFWHNKTRMNYAVFRRQGLPVGSGPVEADCKTLVKRICVAPACVGHGLEDSAYYNCGPKSNQIAGRLLGSNTNNAGQTSLTGPHSYVKLNEHRSQTASKMSFHCLQRVTEVLVRRKFNERSNKTSTGNVR